MIIPFEGSNFFNHSLDHGFHVDNIILLERWFARKSSKYFVQYFLIYMGAQNFVDTKLKNSYFQLKHILTNVCRCHLRPNCSNMKVCWLGWWVSDVTDDKSSVHLQTELCLPT
jgi:hypothetical protein